MTSLKGEWSLGAARGGVQARIANRLVEPAPTSYQRDAVLTAAWLDSPLGPMLAISDDRALLMLEFEERRGLIGAVEELARTAPITLGRSAPIDSAARELAEYFAGERREFATPLALRGSEFRLRVWDELSRIEPGSTLSYLQLATRLGDPKAVRAVAQANGANRLAVMVPCHRVIGSDGGLAGYAAGLERKRWLLEHERSHFGGDQGRAVPSDIVQGRLF